MKCWLPPVASDLLVVHANVKPLHYACTHCISITLTAYTAYVGDDKSFNSIMFLFCVGWDLFWKIVKMFQNQLWAKRKDNQGLK